MFDQRSYVNEFIKDHYKTFKIRVKTEDIVTLAALSRIPNFNQYVLSLITEDIQKRREYPFINNDIIIDFELSKTMKSLVDEAEKADILGDYGLYMNLADAIDSQAKKETSKHLITESQWLKLTRRYHL